VVWAQDTEKPCLPVQDVPASRLAFIAGEKITMMASYTWGVVNTDVGTVSMEVAEKSLYG